MRNAILGWLLALTSLCLFSGADSVQCVPSEPDSPVCMGPVDCEGLPHASCVGFWACEGGACVWHCGSPQTECETPLDCIYLSAQSCCPGPPNPCDLGGMVGTPEEEADVQQWIKENCPEEPICPQYAPPQCSNCYDLIAFEKGCVAGKCVQLESLNCETLCLAAAKSPDEPCPFISHPNLLTPQNLSSCGCTP